MALLAAAAALHFIAPRLVGDYYFGCDNGHYCTAVALQPERAGEAATPWFTLAIDRPPDGAKVALSIAHIDPAAPDETPDYRLSLLIDGKSGGLTFDDKGLLHSPAAAADRILSARTLALANAEGKIVGRISTSGAATARRAVAAVQAHAALRLPRIAVPARSNAAPATLTAGRVHALLTAHDCPGYDGKARFVRLDAATSLALLPCSDEGGGSTDLPLLLSNAGAARAALFDRPYGRASPRPSEGLSNPQFEAASGALAESFDGSGMGDCGEQRAWLWDGRRFRLAFQQIMEQCRGSYAMVPVWRTANLAQMPRGQ